MSGNEYSWTSSAVTVAKLAPPPPPRSAQKSWALVVVNAAERAVGGNELARGDGVRGQAELARVPADDAAE
jgi:hypothetical protein